jgi:NAD(P)-dependent dehydrogenase (short-subunit alcohol dehydrogenase family)
MARIFITGSTDGLGRAAAQALIEKGHQVVLHARSPERAAAVDDLAPRSAGVVIGDLSSATDTRHVANQVNAIGRMDAVIHNAGAYSTKGRSPTPEGHPTITAVNALAPYVLTTLMERPGRLVYLSSGMHRGGSSSLRGIDWSERRWNSSQAYSDSKLYLTTLAFAVARRWPDVLSNARRSRVGCDEDGRGECAGRFRRGISHANMACRERRSRGNGQRPILASRFGRAERCFG